MTFPSWRHIILSDGHLRRRSSDGFAAGLPYWTSATSEMPLPEQPATARCIILLGANQCKNVVNQVVLYPSPDTAFRVRNKELVGVMHLHV